MTWAGGHRGVEQAADELIQEALHREAYGLDGERQRLLDRAAELAPDYAPVKWHQGYVSFQDQWIRADEVVQWSTRDDVLAAYAKMRDEQPDSIAGHLRLADWCRDRKLAPQERAHLLRVIDLDPEHAAARGRLGFRRVDGDWITAEELEAAAQQRRAQQAALAKWRPQFVPWREQLHDRSEKKRNAAAAKIRSVCDPACIAALEAVFSEHSEVAAQLVVEALRQMPEHEATLSLCTHAVTSRWPAVRAAAARELGRRPPESYVPVMLAALYTPVVTQAGLVALDGAGVAYRHAFLREGQEERQLLVLDTQYRRVSLPGGDSAETQRRAWLDSLASAISREQAAGNQNRVTQWRNERIADALAIATGQPLPPDPKRWWDWWDQENSVVLQSEKQLRTIQRTTQVSVVDQSPLSVAPQMGSSAANQSAECFVGGTPVWTVHGPVPIEEIRIGDLVLAQDVETGELSFQPVVRTSVRPAEPLVQIHVGDETLRATRGHLLWVSGQGWVKARDLESGMPVHGLKGALPVSRIEEGADEAETYNLAVDGFRTYFAGETGLLSHDVTRQRPTRTLVPGLAAR